MAKIAVYNTEGKNIGTMDVADNVFAVPVKTTVIHQVYVALMANLRRPWADTKDRGEVSGGGKKPWKQKGTGRARHGSIRSPIWKGGGVTFGPLSTRNYKQKINKKMNQTALRMSLSDRAKEEKFVAVETLPIDGKTKAMASLRKAIPGNGRSTLLITGGKEPMIVRATKNIPGIDVARAADVNVMDVLHHQYLIATKEAVTVLEKRLTREMK